MGEGSPEALAGTVDDAGSGQAAAGVIPSSNSLQEPAAPFFLQAARIGRQCRPPRLFFPVCFRRHRAGEGDRPRNL